MRQESGEAATLGLEDGIIEDFLTRDKNLASAIDEAYQSFVGLQEEYPGSFRRVKKSLVEDLQSGYLNFYAANAVNPYVALAASGPWLVTSHGAVLHDSGGYGMLGFGHSPDDVIRAMKSGHQVMANVMTANFSQRKLVERLEKEIGTREVAKLLFRNSHA